MTALCLSLGVWPPVPNGWDFVLLALAAWRLAYFLVNEEGPRGLARRIRERVGIEHDPDTRKPFSYPDTTLAQILGCVWCASFWTAAIMLGLWLSGPGVVAVLVFGVAGAAVVIEVTVGRLQDG